MTRAGALTLGLLLSNAATFAQIVHQPLAMLGQATGIGDGIWIQLGQPTISPDGRIGLWGRIVSPTGQPNVGGTYGIAGRPGNWSTVLHAGVPHGSGSPVFLGTLFDVLTPSCNGVIGGWGTASGAGPV